MRLNCWEFKKCGRQPGGDKVEESGVCPVATEVLRHGINGGENGGRHCWAIVGTFCRGKVQGTFAKRLKSCLLCEFYVKTREEEGENFVVLQ